MLARLRIFGTMAQIQLLGVATVLLCVIVICWFVAQSKSKGPSMWSLFYHLDNLHDWFFQLVVQSGGTVSFRGPWTRRIVTADPSNVEYVMKTNFHNYVKGAYFRAVFADLFGNTAMFVTDGEDWRRQRAMVSQILVSAKFCSDAVSTTQMLLHDRLLPVLRHASDDALVVDLQDVFHRFTLDFACILGLGMDFKSVSYPFPQIAFADAFDRGMEVCAFRLLMPSFCWKLLRYFNVGTERWLRQDRRIINQCISGFASDREEELRDDTQGQLSDFLSLFMREGGHVYFDDSLRDLCLNTIMAVRDTTAATLTWFFWLVARHPQIEANILAELEGILRQRAAGAEGGNGNDQSPFTVEEMKEMHYLQAALSESLRMYPAAPMDILEAAEDDVLPDGTMVKKGSSIILSFYSMARMHSIWGQDCCELKPERWLRNGKFVNESESKFAVFYGGPRRCLGREIAYLEMKQVAASLIIRYHVEMVIGHPVVPKFGPLLRMKHGLCVTFHPR